MPKRSTSNPFPSAPLMPMPTSNPQNPLHKAEEDDVAGTAEEGFTEGMRQNAMEYNAADADNDNMLDFDEFCAMVQEREVGDFDEATLRKRFDALDGDKSGKVDMQEYIQFSLRDALARSATRVLDLFREWDEDGNGKISRKEFGRAIKALGFNIPKDQLATLFDSINTSGSGTIEYAELNRMLRKQEAIDPSLRPGAAGEIKLEATIKTQLRRAHDGMKGSTLAKGVKLDPNSSTPMIEQLRTILFKNAVRIIDLFRDWDEDKNGLVDKKEFRRAMMALVDVGAHKRDVDRLFDSLDGDKSGSIEFAELNKLLRSGNNAKLAKELQVGAAGKIELESKNKTSIRHGKASGPKIGLTPRPPTDRPPGAGSRSARVGRSGGGASQLSPRRVPAANRGASSARASSSGHDGVRRPPSTRSSASELPPMDGQPPPPPDGRTSPLDGWGFGGGADTLAQLSTTSSVTASRPQSRGGRESHPGSVRALSSRGGARSGLGDGYGGGRPRSEFGGGMPSLDVKMRRAADVYLAAPAPGGLRGRHPSRHASPRARGLPSLTEDRHSWTGGGIGSRDELEAALAQAQTALVMAKERISMLEQQNAALRANAAKVGGGGGGGGGVMGGGGVTKAKLQEASQLLGEKVISADDFAAIKAKYLQDQMGLA